MSNLAYSHSERLENFGFQGRFVPSKQELEALNFLMPLSYDYPRIHEWFLSQVVSGLRDGSRKLVVHERHGRIVALGIGKAKANENKICTVRVAPEYFGRGLGIRIFDELMSWMGTGMPHATVSEDKLSDFEKIFDRYGYQLTSTSKGLYLPDKVEYLFNESKSLLLSK